MDLLMLSIIVISILAGLILGLYYLVLREYCMNAEIDKAVPVAPTVERDVENMLAQNNRTCSIKYDDVSSNFPDSSTTTATITTHQENNNNNVNNSRRTLNNPETTPPNSNGSTDAINNNDNDENTAPSLSYHDNNSVDSVVVVEVSGQEPPTLTNSPVQSDNNSETEATIMTDPYTPQPKPRMMIMRQPTASAPVTPELLRKQQQQQRATMRPPPEHISVHDKRDKMEFNIMMMRMGGGETRPLSYHGRSSDNCRFDGMVVNKRHLTSGSGSGGGGGGSRSGGGRKEANLLNRRSMPNHYYERGEKFDVSELDTNLPRIDLDSIENHLRQAREEERKRRSDREEIRRRLALESDDLIEKPSGGRKPSLQSRLQSSMNLQICFMNETASDSESPNSDTESKNQQPASLPCIKTLPNPLILDVTTNHNNTTTDDFQIKQSRLQIEARQALSQAKEMARMQMAQEKEQRLSPITDMLRNSLEKVGIQLQPERRRLTRQLLTEMNVAQLQVIVNDLHTHIELLNESLVCLLLERDDLHMEQDSMLVDIEDLTRYLAAKDNSSAHHSLPVISTRSFLGKN